MPLVLVKEDGSGLSNANSYASAADGDAYHDGHLYASAWTAATTGSKEAALVMATRVIDAMFRFNGFKRVTGQALQWPRRECRDPDSDSGIVPWLMFVWGSFLDETKVPAAVLQATCELGRELLKTDLTAAPSGQGFAKLRVEGALELDFDPNDRPAPVTPLVQAMLGKLGDYVGQRSGMVPLVRV